MKPNTDQPVDPRIKQITKITPDGPRVTYEREPVATLPACLCGLDTNPVASPRMDIHCPKHDAPKVGGERPRAIFDAGFSQAGGEPELLPDQVVAMIKESVDCEYGDLVGYKARLEAALVDLNLLLNSRVSQPAGDDVREFTKHLMQRHSEVSANMPRRWCSVHKREEFKYESLEHEIDVEKARAFDAAQRADNKDNPNSQPAGEPSDEEFNPWYENYEKEVARALVDDWTNYVGLTEDEALDGNTVDALVDDIATALARRAGTPTTDAREIVDLLSSVLGHLHVINGEANLLVNFPDDPNLRPKERGQTIQEYRLKAHHKICESIDAATAFSSTPSDGVAQRARTAAEAVVAEWKVDMGKAISYERMITDIESGIVKHFTATDVEQGTCTEHEK